MILLDSLDTAHFPNNPLLGESQVGQGGERAMDWTEEKSRYNPTWTWSLFFKGSRS